ncbi:hypothetical protein A2U01_0072856, partial [Trifolium medium]|nr:hypothetical protein [Trifolium medium]
EMEIWDKTEVVEIVAYKTSPLNTTLLGCCSRHLASGSENLYPSYGGETQAHARSVNMVKHRHYLVVVELVKYSHQSGIFLP